MSNEELVQLYQNGDKQALNELVEKNMGIVNKLVNKFYVEKINSIDIEDLKQEGYIGLLVAAKKYDINNPKKAKFITYAVYWIYHKMSRFIRNMNTNKETSLNTPIGEKENSELMDYIEGVDYSFENVEEKIYIQQLHQELEQAMNQYTSLKEREILKLHYGWDNIECMTLQEIGELMGKSIPNIEHAENTACNKLWRSGWGKNKALELYDQKRKQAVYSYSETMENISFAEKYLRSEGI